jgi:uncharacterized protein YbaP (TraB family)
MIRRSLPWLLCLFGLVGPAGAQTEAEPTAKPFLWKVEGEGLEKPSFLFGTIHLPDDRVLALSDVVVEALDACDSFYTEIPMDMATQMGAMQFMQLKPPQTLKDVLPPDLLERADGYLQRKGFQLVMFARFKPWAVMGQIALADYMRDVLMGKKPLDSMLYARQERAGKTVGGIETIEEQVGAFEQFSQEEILRLFELGLEKVEEAEKQGTSPSEPMIQAYLSGDTAVLDKLFEDEYAAYGEELAKRFNDLLLVVRNGRMVERIAARLQEDKANSHFFAIGAAHALGETGLIKQLGERGFTVTRLTAEDAGTLTPEPAGAGGR